MPDRRVVLLLVGLCLVANGAVTTVAARQLQDDALQRSAPASASLASEPLSDSADAFKVGSAPFANLFTPQAKTPSLLQAAAGAQVPTEPTHTGFSALVHSTGSDFAAFPRRKSTWVILGIGAGAAAIAYPFDGELNERLNDANGLRKVLKPGKYLGYAWVQAGAAVGLYVVGRYAMKPDPGTRHTNKVSHLGFDLLRANIVTQAFTYGLKYAVQRDRPTGECCAFPSGHASVTFATASVLERHFGYRASWPMFAIAGYVSASRLTDNRHFLSDVLFGSALGMATGWTVVGRHGRHNFALYPVPMGKGVMLAGTWSPAAKHRERTD